jgi:hypothetical protein
MEGRVGARIISLQLLDFSSHGNWLKPPLLVRLPALLLSLPSGFLLGTHLVKLHPCKCLPGSASGYP